MRCLRVPSAFLLLAALGLFLPRTAWADPPESAGKVGTRVESFTLKDTAGKSWSLDDVKDRKAVVVVFLGTECPVNNAYVGRLAELHKAYEPQGVQFVGVNANRQDTAARVAEHAKKNAIPFPVLKDEGNVVADRFGAVRTPEALVLDADRVIRYRGRIDDQFGVGVKRPAPTRRDLAEALDEVLAGKPVTKAETEVAGCLIARVARPKAEGGVTYGKEVSRILQNRCQECHRPGQVGPFALMKYEDAAAWADNIREVVTDGRMPPWHADPAHGKFSNDRRLPAEEKEQLLAWIKQGCPKGDDKDLPPPKELVEGWRIGKPDVVLSMTKEYKVPATAPAKGIEYQYFAVPTDFKEDVWVQAAEAKPGNRAVVHHMIVYVRHPDNQARKPADGIGAGFLSAYAPGDMPLVLEPGRAKKIPKGSQLVFQMHYTPNGTEQADRSSVGLIFAKEPPKQEVRTRGIAQQHFGIPPGDDNYKVVSATVFHDDAVLLTLMPHMHLRGKSFEYRVVYPDRKSTRLNSSHLGISYA